MVAKLLVSLNLSEFGNFGAVSIKDISFLNLEILGNSSCLKLLPQKIHNPP